MAYKPYKYNRRALKRYARNSKRNFIISIILVILLSYIALIWILPNFIGILGSFKKFISPPSQMEIPEDTTASSAPPVITIPYEATNTSQIDIQGYATPGSKVTLFMDDEQKEEIESFSDGSFTFQNIQLSLGTNNIYGKTKDENGKMSLSSKNLTVIFDNEKPSLEINEPEDNKNVSGERKIKISGKTETGAKIIVNGTQVIVNQEGSFQSEQNLVDGENIFNIKAYDTASNFIEISRRVIFTP